MKLKVLLLCLFVSFRGLSQVFPSNQWTTSSPEDQGLNGTILTSNLNALSNAGNVVIIRNGYLVASKGNISRKERTYSVSKSITALMFARALQLGLVNYDDPVRGSNNPSGPSATFRNFLTMTSDYGLTPHNPGSNHAYNNNAIEHYGKVIREDYFNNVSRQASIHTTLFDIIGDQDGANFNGIMSGWGGGWSISARDAARIGWLISQKGKWNNAQIIPESFVNNLFQSQIPENSTANYSRGPNDQWNQHQVTEDLAGNYSFGWWLAHNRFENVNDTIAYASGWRGNKIFVLRDHQIVIAVINTVLNNRPSDADYINAILEAVITTTPDPEPDPDPDPQPDPDPIPEPTVCGYRNADISGELKAYHKVTITWDGPEATETEETFRDYRLTVRFNSPSGKKYYVPGYFAADGNALASSATAGNKWRCHFLPLESGTWSYITSFKKGTNAAIDLSDQSGTPISFDGNSGIFEVSETNKTGIDFRSKGKLTYVGEHHLKWTDNSYFLKVGANSPELFLEYTDFDGTSSNRTYSNHIQDWQNGDPTWKNEKGKGIIGVINYLADQGLNSHYFLAMNAYGDGNQAFPWINRDSYYVYDVSKLDQWQLVFDHMMKKGIMIDLVTTEQENQSYFEFNEPSEFATSRKVFYRELVARFGYLNAIVWNLGEENGWQKDNQRGKANTTNQRLLFASYLDSLLHYQDNIVIHNGPSDNDDIFIDLVGNNSYTGTSYQGRLDDAFYGHDRILHWINSSADANKKWVVSYDEPYTNDVLPSLIDFRKKSVWPSLVTGGAGAQLYMGGGKDISEENYRIYKDYWETLHLAYSFFEDNTIPYQLMSSKDDEVTNGHCLSLNNEYYVIYLPNGETTELNLSVSNQYSVKWYDPRNGGPLTNGTISNISGTGYKSLGFPPHNTSNDWVVLVKNESIPMETVSNNNPIQISANPAGNQVLSTSIHPDIEILRTILYDGSGKTVKKVTKGEMNTSMLPRGVYYLKYKTTQGWFTKKLVK